MVYALALILIAASVRDLRTRRIPNGLIAAGLLLGPAGHLWHGGGPGLLGSLAGIAAALPLLLLYAVRAFGAGDVKLLMVVGAFMGPAFLLWTLLGAIFAGGLMALIRVVHLGVPSRMGRSSRMPFAPAIALGAAWAFVHLHGRLW